MATNDTNKQASTQAALEQGIKVATAAKAEIGRLEGELKTASEKAAAFIKQADAARAMAPKLAALMIKAGRMKPEQQAKLMDNITNPAKLASELAAVLELTSTPATAGRPEQTSKAASAEHSNPDDNYRRQVGLL